jgi:rhodanese-related sulfurtransferase
MHHRVRGIAMKKIVIAAVLLCAGAASPPGCGGAGGGHGGDAGGAIGPGTPLDIPFGTYKHIASGANRFFKATSGESYWFALKLQQQIKAQQPVFVLDVRDDTNFRLGHIPTAVNVPAAVLFTDSGLAQLPVDGTPIVTVGRDDHTASMVAGALGSLGYNVYALRYGMMGWNLSTTTDVYKDANNTQQTIFGLGGPIVQ